MKARRCHYCKRKTSSPFYLPDELSEHSAYPHSVTPNPDALPLCELARLTCKCGSRCCERHGTHSMPHKGCILR